jgi:hypothetical protein
MSEFNPDDLPDDPNEPGDIAMARCARRFAKESLAALVLAVRAPEALPPDVLRIQVQAATEILSRGYGRPGMANTIPTVIEPEDLERLIRDARTG